MKCHKRIRVIVIIALVSLLVTMLAITQLHIEKHGGFVCLHCAIPYLSINNYSKLEEDKFWQVRTARTQHNKVTVNDRSLHHINDALKKSANHSWKSIRLQAARQNTSITIPAICVEKNCQEFLSKEERVGMNTCERAVRTRERYNGPIYGSDCKFLPERGRHPVALVSARGSGNTWTRGLLERATGICTGFYYCDRIMRAHGFVGENIKSGKVLVVKTHSVVPRWVGERNLNKNTHEPSYSSAVFILRNPVMSAIAEWNRRASQNILGKNNSAIAHERHTYIVPTNLFKGKKWDRFLHLYLKDWRERLEHWVTDQDTHPVHVLRYEDLQRDTPGEIKKVLDFLHVSHDLNVLKENLMEDYSEFHRPHDNTSFEHYSLQQKQLLRSVMIDATQLAERRGKAQLLQLNEYLFSIHDY